MNIRRLDQIVALFLAGFGGYLIWAGLGYGYMLGTTPGPGYFPVLIGGVLVVLSLVNFVRSVGGIEKIKVDMSRRDIAKFAMIVAILLVFVYLIDFLGLTLATMLMMFAIAFVIRPSLARNYLLRLTLTAVLTPIACKLIFGNLLHVPIPTGILGF